MEDVIGSNFTPWGDFSLHGSFQTKYMHKIRNVSKNQSMKNMVRQNKEEALEQRMIDKERKRLQQRQELIRRINEENEKRMQIEPSLLFK